MPDPTPALSPDYPTWTDPRNGEVWTVKGRWSVYGVERVFLVSTDGLERQRSLRADYFHQLDHGFSPPDACPTCEGVTA